jgi:hypothetical protein
MPDPQIGLQNAKQLFAEAMWLQSIIHYRTSKARVRCRVTLGGRRVDWVAEREKLSLLETMPPPVFKGLDSCYSQFVSEHAQSSVDRLLLILTLVNHLMPDLLVRSFAKHSYVHDPQPIPEEHLEFGLIKGVAINCWVPTGITFLFLVSAYDLVDRLEAQRIFTDDHLFARLGILGLEPHYKGDPSLSGRLIMEEKWVEYFTLGEIPDNDKMIKFGFQRGQVELIEKKNPIRP